MVKTMELNQKLWNIDLLWKKYSAVLKIWNFAKKILYYTQ